MLRGLRMVLVVLLLGAGGGVVVTDATPASSVGGRPQAEAAVSRARPGGRPGRRADVHTQAAGRVPQSQAGVPGHLAARAPPLPGAAGSGGPGPDGVGERVPLSQGLRAAALPAGARQPGHGQAGPVPRRHLRPRGDQATDVLPARRWHHAARVLPVDRGEEQALAGRPVGQEAGADRPTGLAHRLARPRLRDRGHPQADRPGALPDQGPRLHLLVLVQAAQEAGCARPRCAQQGEVPARRGRPHPGADARPGSHPRRAAGGSIWRAPRSPAGSS